jgi:RimJ/RimL family protein N-acetyltransferase
VRPLVPDGLELALGDLLARALTVDDAELVVEATATSPDAVWVPDPPPYPVERARSFLADYEARRRAGGAATFGVFGADAARLLAGLVLQVHGPGDIEVAYWTRPEARRRGVAARSLAAVSGWVEDTLRPHRLWVEIAPGNTPSLRTAARAGYGRARRDGERMVLMRDGPHPDVSR